MTWPGLNEPIKLGKGSERRQKQQREMEDRGKFSRANRMDPTKRGWTGTTWPGRHAGAPQLPNGGDHVFFFLYVT